MMRGALIFSAVLAVAGCATGAARSFSDPAVQELYKLPTPLYYATLAVAADVAAGCERYRYDAALDEMVNEKRNEAGRGSLSAYGLGEAIDIETDVSRRSFSARHGVVLGRDNTCAAADAETQAGTALSAALVPTR